MTIFLKIIRDHLINELTDYMGNSSAADKSFFNRISQSLSAGRESTLSTKKRAIASQLLHTLNNLNPSIPALPKAPDTNLKEKDKESKLQSDKTEISLAPDNLDESILIGEKTFQDKAIAEQIIKLLTDAKDEAKKICDALNYDEGTFGPLILDNVKVINKFLEKLTDMQLQDVLDDSDPYNKFCFHMASYLFKNTLAELHSSTLDKITNNPKITNSRKLTREKEELVKEMIKTCKEDLDVLNKNHSKYRQHRQKCVLDNIGELKRRNVDKVNEYGINVSVPITFAFFSTLNINAPKLGPEAGTLNNCLTLAENEIRMENLGQLVENNTSSVNTLSL
ncbi:coiled-coil protein [Legionella busanensis]|uniref:Coiled-coil protein n=1 Tax=Legionella busanensis TaxID=190655 RepID=A0A378JRP3_9GAMM|nr:hypothetical protein [Legionella busanensis]STX52903.1 coiled-coil protein [Legionella busanensis]